MNEFTTIKRRSINLTVPMLIFVAVCLLATSALVGETQIKISPSANVQTVEFTPNGSIVWGSKSVWKYRYANVRMCIDNDAICTLTEHINLGKGDTSTQFFMNRNVKLVKNSEIYTADIRDTISSDKKLGTYKQSMELLENGMIKIGSTLLLDDPALLKTRYFKFQFPPYLVLCGNYVKGEKIINFDGKKTVSFSGDELKGATVRFFPDSQAKSFTIFPDGCSKMSISPNSITFHSNPNGVMSFLLDIRGTIPVQQTSELSPNGIDFWEIDQLHLPDYGASHNLILNPSFEAGLRYWGYPCYANGLIPLKYQNFYSLDEKEAHSGSCSLRVKALSIRCPLSLGPFALPFIPGKQYALSFYAKGSSDKNLSVNLWGRELKRTDLFPQSVSTFFIDSKWKRYTTTFVPNDRFGGIYFGAQLTGSASDQQEETVWIDDIQLEEGSLTDFTQAPVTAQMVSAARGNFLKYEQNPDFKLLIQSRPDSEGTVSLSVTNFFFKTIFTETYQFKTDSTGKSSILLEKLSKKITDDKLRGVFAVKSVFTIKGVDRPFKDYFRFSVMDFLDNTHKNKNLFALFYAYSLQDGGPDMERFLERERAIGFGSFACDFGSFANDLDYALDKERIELVEKYGITPMGRSVLKLHGGIGGEISEENGKIKMINIKKMTMPTDAELTEFENICAVKAAKRPWNTIWWFTGESNPGCMPLEAHPDAFAKFLLATLRGIKKGNPQAKVLIEGGPYNLDPQSGTKWVERYIQDTKRLDPTARFDGAAAHHYRNFPENPDLDSDIAAFLVMLDRNGCNDWPFYINEGGNYVPFNVPQEGISPYIMHSANSWYFGPLSYHIGKAELIASAFSARNWLVALKYQDRVACMQDFGTPNRYMDFDFSARVYDKVPNTLGRLLGNASFYKDIRFAPYIRCYAFKEDKTGTPIAAIWGHKESVDRWKEDAPLYSFDFGNQDIKYIDLMENEVNYPKGSDGRTALIMSPFPLFIKGKPGTEEMLCSAIANGVAASADAGTVEIYAYPTAIGQAAVVLKNLVSKEFEGQAKLTLNGVEIQVPLQLSPLGQKEETVGMRPAALDYGKPQPFDFIWSVNGTTAKHLSASYMLLKNNSPPALSVAGNLSDWKALPAVNCGEGIQIRTAVSNENLLVAVEAKGQNQDVFAGTGLFIDPMWKKEHWHLPRLVTQDLAVFEFIKSSEGPLAAFCHYAQGTQAGSGSSYLVQRQIQKRITVKTSTSEDAAWLIFSVPQEVLSPLILKPGNRFGLNLIVPLKNGGRTLAPIRNFKKPIEPGEIYFLTVIVCD